MGSTQPQRIEVLGVPVDCVTMPTALAQVDAMIAGRRPGGSVIAVNPEKVIKAAEDPALLAQLQQAALLIPDGIGMVWAARLLGLGDMQRVPGAELMPAICELAAAKGYSIFLYGGRAEVVEAARRTLEGRLPGLRVAGHQHGFLAEDEMPDLVNRINESGADVLFIALGSPRQELWMAKFLSLLNVKVCQGVGGTFDVLAGSVRRAPEIWRNLNLEWAYRLLSQPSRLTRQTALPRFVWRVLAARVGGQRARGSLTGGR